MEATTTLIQAKADYYNQKNEASVGVRAFQNAVLSELPGVTFAIITLVYLVSSLVRL